MIPHLPPISAVVPAWRRPEALQHTLRRLLSCDPPPAEILVHLDGNDVALRSLVETHFPQVRLLHSTTLQGPGGARNRLMQESRCPWVAHFDDDSYPANADYFARAWRLINLLPDTAVWAACILPNAAAVEPGLWLQAYYVGCGHVMNRAWFLRTRGYLPLPIAYNLEEVDVSLQLHDLGGRCLLAGELRVLHDHPPPAREATPTQVAMMINTVLFPMLRYPVVLWPQAAGSILRRLLRLMYQGEWRVIWQSVRGLPAAMRRFFPARAPARAASVRAWLQLRRSPLRVAPGTDPAA